MNLKKLLFNKQILFVLTIAFIFRLIFLNFIPAGINNDELHFVLNAKAVYYHFTDMSGRWNPLSFTTIPGEASSELTFFLLAPLIGPLPTNLFTARLPFVIFSVATIYLIYLICKKLIDQKSALIIALVLSLNPWSIYVARTSFDAPIAIFFYFLSFYLILYLKGWKILYSLIPLVFAFYTYIGTKVILIPFVLIITIYTYIFINKRRYLLQYIFLLISSLLIVFYFLTNLNKQATASRISELSTPNTQEFINLVDIERNLTFDSPLKNLYSNRYVYYSTKFIQKYLNSFSPDILFLHGDPSYLVSLWKHGYFYLIDFLFLILGLCYLYSKSKPIFVLFSTLTLIAPIPEAIRSSEISAYAFHSALQYPLLSIFIGLGIYSITKLFSNNKINRLFILLLISIYVISFTNFFNTYFFQYPLYQPEGFGFSRQIVSQYLDKLPNNTPVYIITQEPDSLFRNYLFYSNKYTKSNFPLIKSQYQNPRRTELAIDQFHFATDFPNLSTSQLLITQAEISPPNFKLIPRLSVNNLSNHNEQYYIFNDSTCINYSKLIPPKINFSNLNLTSLSTPNFCQLYLRSPK